MPKVVSLPTVGNSTPPQQKREQELQAYWSNLPLIVRAWAIVYNWFVRVTPQTWHRELWAIAPTLIYYVSGTALFFWSARRFFYLLPKAFTLFRTIFSRNVSNEEYLERENACMSCPAYSDNHCKACACPEWFLSRLTYKNKKRGHLCPLKRHKGNYPTYHDFLFQSKKQGCGACNKGKQPPKTQ